MSIEHDKANLLHYIDYAIKKQQARETSTETVMRAIVEDDLLHIQKCLIDLFEKIDNA